MEIREGIKAYASAGLNPAEMGMRLINTPKHSFNLWTTYSLRKIHIGGGARSRFIQSGLVRSYALGVLGGAVLIVAFLVFRP